MKSFPVECRGGGGRRDIPGARASARKKCRLAFLTVLLIAALPLLAAAQSSPPRIVIGDSVACSACRVRLEKLVRLGSPTDSALIGRTNTVAVDSRGNYYVPVDNGTRIGVYSRDGRLQTVFGRPGDGPGEFRGIGALTVMRGDTIVASDARSQRVSFFAPDHKFVRSVAVNFSALRLHPLPGGTLVGAGALRTRDGLGRAAHIISSTGVGKSFGRNDADARPGMLPQEWKTGLASGARIWAFSRTIYELQLFDSTGSPVMVVERTARNFPNRTADSVTDQRVTRPLPRVDNVTELPNGNVAVVLVVAARDWKAQTGLPPSRLKADEVVRPTWSTSPILEMMVEVLDTRGGRLVSTAYLPAFVTGVVAPGVVFSLDTNADGVFAVDVWRLVVAQQ